MTEITLTRAERDSELWLKLLKHFEARLNVLRVQNDNDKGAEETAKQRGRIAEVKSMIALNDDKPEFRDAKKER